jgi:hypothetical protein
MKPTAAIRLSAAITSLQMGIYHYCKRHVETPHQYGLCIISPKEHSVRSPSKVVYEELQQQAKDHFFSLNKRGVYSHYFDPYKILPKTLDPKIQREGEVNDYSLIFRTPAFDNKWEMQTIARAFVYCASQEDMGGWNEWYDPQLEAIRLTINLHDALKESSKVLSIRHQLSKPSLSIFNDFAATYIKQDDHIPELYRRKHWSLLYPDIKNLIKKETTLYECYQLAKEHANMRNEKERDLLRAFVKYVEEFLIINTDLQKELKDHILHDLRTGEAKHIKQKYWAKKPEVCISDLECAQFLIFILKKFQSSPQKYQTLGEVALFIWICQHAAFSEVRLDINDILNIRVTDIDFEEFIIKTNRREVTITIGFKSLLQAWMGKTDRENKRFLLPSLTKISNLEKTVAKYSKNLFGIEGGLKPRDFLGKTHPIPGARIAIEVRELLDTQMEMAKHSPYCVKMHEIKKRIRSA